jgi:hypothetical protein
LIEEKTRAEDQAFRLCQVGICNLDEAAERGNKTALSRLQRVALLLVSYGLNLERGPETPSLPPTLEGPPN